VPLLLRLTSDYAEIFPHIPRAGDFLTNLFRYPS